MRCAGRVRGRFGVDLFACLEDGGVDMGGTPSVDNVLEIVERGLIIVTRSVGLYGAEEENVDRVAYFRGEVEKAKGL